MESFWGDGSQSDPTYSESLRHFIHFNTSPKVITELQRLAANQSMLERKWFDSREQLRKNGASAEKLRDFDRRIHDQASKFAADMNRKLAYELDIPLFKPHGSPTAAKERAKFMRFLSDLIG